MRSTAGACLLALALLIGLCLVPAPAAAGGGGLVIEVGGLGDVLVTPGGHRIGGDVLITPGGHRIERHSKRRAFDHRRSRFLHHPREGTFLHTPRHDRRFLHGHGKTKRFGKRPSRIIIEGDGDIIIERRPRRKRIFIVPDHHHRKLDRFDSAHERAWRHNSRTSSFAFDAYGGDRITVHRGRRACSDAARDHGLRVRELQASGYLDDVLGFDLVVGRHGRTGHVDCRYHAPTGRVSLRLDAG